MKYHIVAGEELKKIMASSLGDAIPFNEDMSHGDYQSVPFTEAFFTERASCHGVTIEEYKNKLSAFLGFLGHVNGKDEVHLYFGEDATCLANRALLIEYLKPRVGSLVLHIVDEYTGAEIKAPQVIL